jgi:hypothetical protein
MKQYRILRTLVPTISEKRNVSKLEVIEETVRYIEELQNRLIDSIGETEAHHKMAQTANFTLNQLEALQDENKPTAATSNRPTIDSPESSQLTASSVVTASSVSQSTASSVMVRRRSSLSKLRQ